jgi:hypothetical protein
MSEDGGAGRTRVLTNLGGLMLDWASYVFIAILGAGIVTLFYWFITEVIEEWKRRQSK